MAFHSTHRARYVWTCHGRQLHRTAHSFPERPVFLGPVLFSSWTQVRAGGRGDIKGRVHAETSQHAFNESLFRVISNVRDSQLRLKAHPVYQVSSPRLLVGNFRLYSLKPVAGTKLLEISTGRDLRVLEGLTRHGSLCRLRPILQSQYSPRFNSLV